MDFTLLFDPLSENLTLELFSSPSFLNQEFVFTEGDMPDWSNADIALVGVSDNRGTVKSKGVSNGPDEFRKKFYQLKRGVDVVSTVDLGNLKSGFTLDDTKHRLAEVCELLLSNNVFPIVIGSTHDFSLSICHGVENSLGKVLTLVNIDARIDSEGNDISEECFLSNILTENFKYNYAHLAHQGFLVDGQLLRKLENKAYELFRLGDLREDLKEAEPVLRAADVMAFDLSAIRRADAPAQQEALPFGLTAEESCKIAWYAGQSDKMKAAGFFSYNPEFDMQGQTAWQLAVMVWYFIEGFNQKVDSTLFHTSDYSKFTVTLGGETGDLIFFRNVRSGKWWLEVNKNVLVIPCAYTDYEQAMQGSIPDRWVRAQQRHSS